VKTGRGPIMEEVLCAMALKSANGRQTHHTQTGLPVCCEQALKSAGEQNTHGGCRCGDLRETARAKEVTLRGGVKRLCISAWHRWWRFGCAGKLLTGNIGSLCEQQPLKALRAPCGPTPQYKILYCYYPERHHFTRFLGYGLCVMYYVLHIIYYQGN
jgi:hypothetical protein